jgi:hypothetical protein
MAASTAFAEDELGRKWDRCLTDVVLKTGNGFILLDGVNCEWSVEKKAVIR